MAIRTPEKGKNFSGANTVERNERDMYQTPTSITRHLLSREDFIEPILEPASGEGAIVRILKEKYEHVQSYDLHHSGRNFLEDERKVNSVITNPPYSLANEFIRHAKEIVWNKFAFLLPLDYLYGQERYETIYSVEDTFPLTALYVFTRKPMLSEKLKENGKYPTGMMAYAWYVWTRAPRIVPSNPVVFFIDNQADTDGTGVKRHPPKNSNWNII